MIKESELASMFDELQAAEGLELSADQKQKVLKITSAILVKIQKARELKKVSFGLDRLPRATFKGKTK